MTDIEVPIGAAGPGDGAGTGGAGTGAAPGCANGQCALERRGSALVPVATADSGRMRFRLTAVVLTSHAVSAGAAFLSAGARAAAAVLATGVAIGVGALVYSLFPRTGDAPRQGPPPLLSDPVRASLPVAPAEPPRAHPAATAPRANRDEAGELDERRRAVLVVHSTGGEPVWQAVEAVLERRTRRFRLSAERPGKDATRSFEYRLRLKRKVTPAALLEEIREHGGPGLSRLEFRARR